VATGARDERGGEHHVTEAVLGPHPARRGAFSPSLDTSQEEDEERSIVQGNFLRSNLVPGRRDDLKKRHIASLGNGDECEEGCRSVWKREKH